MGSPDDSRTTIARWATAVATLVLLAIVVAADRQTLPVLVQRAYAFPGGDKLGHVVLFGGLAFLAGLGFTRHTRPVAGMRVPVSALVVALLVTVEEATQSEFPGRTRSMLDLLASYTGIVVGAYAAYLARQRADPAG